MIDCPICQEKLLSTASNTQYYCTTDSNDHIFNLMVNDFKDQKLNYIYYICNFNKVGGRFQVRIVVNDYINDAAKSNSIIQLSEKSGDKIVNLKYAISFYEKNSNYFRNKINTIINFS